MAISVVLPAKNESGAIGQTIERIQKLQIVDEIIVINDNSSDNSAKKGVSRSLCKWRSLSL